MASQSRAYLTALPRLAPTAAIMAVALLTFALLIGFSSLLGENYRADPPFLHPFRAPTRDEAMLAYPAEYALKSTEYNDVLFLGDSTCRCSIDPAMFQRSSGLSAYNLGSMGVLGIDGYRLTLQIYLQHHPKPRAVVLAVTPDDFDVESSQELDGLPYRYRWSYGPDSRAAFRLPEDLVSATHFARRGVQIGHAYWANPRAVRRFDPRVQFLYGGGSDTYLTLEQKIRQSRGYWALKGKHWASTESPNKPTVTVASQWDPGLRGLVDVAEANGVLLVIRLVPIVDTTKTDYGPVRCWLEDLERKYERVAVIRPEILLYDAELCWDYQHLNADGVGKFSRSLAKDVTEALARRAVRAPDKVRSDGTNPSPSK
jgi:hypothetical protein